MFDYLLIFVKGMDDYFWRRGFYFFGLDLDFFLRQTLSFLTMAQSLGWS